MNGIDNILDAQAIEISLVGLVIVFLALSTVSLFLWALPKLTNWLEPILHEYGLPVESHSSKTKHVESIRDDLDVIAAIGVALHRHQQD